MEECQICKKSMKKEFRPFCSRRCMLLDLSKWLNRDYTVPLEEKAEDNPNSINEDPNDKKKL